MKKGVTVVYSVFSTGLGSIHFFAVISIHLQFIHYITPIIPPPDPNQNVKARMPLLGMKEWIHLRKAYNPFPQSQLGLGFGFRV